MVQKSGQKATCDEKTPVNYGTTGAGFVHQQYVFIFLILQPLHAMK